MPITPVSGGAAAFQSLTALADTATTKAPTAASTKGFGDAISGAIQNLSDAHNKADGLATQAATGNLADVHDYTIAATEASLATELTVAVRNKAVEAFNQIMNLPL